MLATGFWRLLRDPAWMEVARVASDAAPIDDHVVYVDNPHHRDQILRSCLTDDGMGLGVDLYRRDVDATDLSVSTYSTSTLGLGLRFSVPITEGSSMKISQAPSPVGALSSITRSPSTLAPRSLKASR